MGNISIQDTGFKPASLIYSKVKRFLKSYSDANLLDEGEFPTYVKEIIGFLGISLYKECQALVEIKNHQACLPSNFKYLHEAYKCTPDFSVDDKGCRSHLQTDSSFTMKITDKIAVTDVNCEINCCEMNNEISECITVLTSVNEHKMMKFSNLCPLRLSPNVSPDLCTSQCQQRVNRSSPYEISIKDKILYTNFTDDCVYIKYYGFPVDANGDLLILNEEKIEKAIEWYIIYQFFISEWFNSSIQDIQAKAKEAQFQYEQAFAEAKFLIKLPSFAEMINMIRNQRSNNKLVFFTQQISKGNFQRSR